MTTTEEAQQVRVQRALEALADNLWRITPHGDHIWWVENGGGQIYIVTRARDAAWTCSCDDYPPADVVCKHIVGVQIFIGEREAMKIDRSPSRDTSTAVSQTEELRMSHEPFDFMQAKTLTGLTPEQVLAEMQKPLPATAYKPVPGASDLTDIDPAYLTEAATKVFGPAGFGWWYDFEPTDLAVSAEVRTAKSGREYTVYTASLHKLIVRYRLIDPSGNLFISEPITATGGNDNEVESYAVRGAVTNAIGAAFAKLTWQLPVYKGELSHRNAATFGDKKPATKPIVKPTPATAKTEAESASDGNGHDAELANLLNFVIPTTIQSKHAGKKLAEVSPQVLEWYATKMAVTTPESQVLKDKATALLALQMQSA